MLQTDGQIIIAGNNFNTNGEGAPSDFVIVRYNKDGALNDHFGENGIVITDINGSDIAYDALLQPDGKIVVVGKQNQSILFLVRYNGDVEDSQNLQDKNGCISTVLPGMIFPTWQAIPLP